MLTQHLFIAHRDTITMVRQHKLLHNFCNNIIKYPGWDTLLHTAIFAANVPGMDIWYAHLAIAWTSYILFPFWCTKKTVTAHNLTCCMWTKYGRTNTPAFFFKACILDAPAHFLSNKFDANYMCFQNVWSARIKANIVHIYRALTKCLVGCLQHVIWQHINKAYKEWLAPLCWPWDSSAPPWYAAVSH